MKEMTLDTVVENIQVVTNFITEELERLRCSNKAQTQICIAIDELFGNIVHYAYSPKVGKATVRFEVEETPLSVVITFIDHGRPFNPLGHEMPDIQLPVSERREGGLGIFLVKKTMNMVEYAYQNGQNILRIKKDIT